MEDNGLSNEEVNLVVLEIEDNYRANERLDVLVTSRLPGISRNRVQKLISEGNIKLDGQVVKSSTIVQGSSKVEVIFPHPPRPDAIAEDIPLDLCYEDEHLIVVNKPAGMVVHPAAGHHSGTLVNALLWHYQSLPVTGDKPSKRPGIVHRLDKNTSGLLVVARTENMMTALGKMFHDHLVEREYEALVWGHPPDHGTIDAPIARSQRDRKKYAVGEDGKSSISHWRVIKHYNYLTHIAVTLETGRTHQIRVHFASRGWPVFSDETYGGRLHGTSKLLAHDLQTVRAALKMMPRQALHARKLGLIHPATNEHLEFNSKLPEDFLAVLEALK